MPEEKPDQNRRQADRINTKSQNMDVQLGEDVHKIKDISETGFAIVKTNPDEETRDLIEQHLPVRFAFKLGDEEKIADCETRVVWESETEAGLEIIESDTTTKDNLAELIDCFKKGEKII